MGKCRPWLFSPTCHPGHVSPPLVLPIVSPPTENVFLQCELSGVVRTERWTLWSWESGEIIGEKLSLVQTNPHLAGQTWGNCGAGIEQAHDTRGLASSIVLQCATQGQDRLFHDGQHDETYVSW